MYLFIYLESNECIYLCSVPGYSLDTAAFFDLGEDVSTLFLLLLSSVLVYWFIVLIYCVIRENSMYSG